MGNRSRNVCRALYGLDSSSTALCGLPKISRSSSNVKQWRSPPVAPGPLANNAIGIFGIIAVVLAGWTTANPTIYRAGLAFQAILPKLSTAKVTLLAGSLATVAGLFPAFAMKLLGFVALYGFILAPFGAVIVFEHFFHKPTGIVKNYAEKANLSFNNSVFFAWLTSFGLFYFISVQFDVFLVICYITGLAVLWDTVFGVEQVFSGKELKQFVGFFEDSGQK